MAMLDLDQLLEAPNLKLLMQQAEVALRNTTARFQHDIESKVVADFRIPVRAVFDETISNETLTILLIR